MFHLFRVARSIVREKWKAHKRSSKWPTVRDGFLKSHPSCASCGSCKLLQVHHIQPFHLHPLLELEPDNLITLCMSKAECHLHIGHGNNWKAWNPDVQADALESLHSPSSRKWLAMEAAAKAKKVSGV
jgi:hypothetical protein